MDATVERSGRSGLRARTWRVLGVLSLAGAVAALGSAVAYGYFGTHATGTGKAKVGSITLVPNASATKVCNLGTMVPGESSKSWTGSPAGNTDTACTFSVQYLSTGASYIGITTTLGGSNLYAASGLRFQITDTASTAYTTGGTINPNTSSHALYVATDPHTATHTFTINFSLPSTVANSFQTKTTTLKFTVYAISTGGQFATTTGHSGGTACAKGQQCPGITRWS